MRRGLFRIFVIISFLWAVMVWVACDEAHKSDAILAGIAGPALLLAVWFTLVWIAKGFAGRT
jgi:hypothetical protein